MLDRYAFVRLARALPATTAAVICTILLLLGLVYGYATGGVNADAGDVVLPVLFIFGLFVVLGLVMDGSANARAKTHWDDVLPASATDVERLASCYFADRGWDAQRDDSDFKVFVRRTRLNIPLLVVLAFLGVFPAVLYLAFWSLSRPEAMTISVTPVSSGASIELIGPSAAIDGFYRALDLELPRPHFDRVASGGRSPKTYGSDER